MDRKTEGHSHHADVPPKNLTIIEFEIIAHKLGLQ